MKIVRTPTKVAGGLTPAEKVQMAEHAKLWIGRAMRTDPIEPGKIVPAIEGLYAAAGLKKPRVVIVPSPLVMAFAYGASAAIWHRRKSSGAIRAATYAAADAAATATCAAARAATNAATDAAATATCAATRDATYTATRAATRDATYTATRAAARAATNAATYAATYAATDAAARAATNAATDAATDAAARAAMNAATDTATYTATAVATRDAAYGAEQQARDACEHLAGDFGLACAKRWFDVYQGGNMWGCWDAYISAARDVLGLRLPQYEKYAVWEQAAIHGGFRVLHEEFCIVSDFPEVLKVDAENRPHCETGPSHRWRDGWSLYHWHGVKIPAEWIEDRGSLTAEMALTWPNIEQRRAACEIVGWAAILRDLKAMTIDRDDDPEIGELVEVVIEGNRERFLKVLCGTKRSFALPVPPETKTALEGNAWTYGVDPDLIKRIEVRT